MNPKRINTLLLIKRDRLVRADLTAPNEVRGADVHDAPRPAADDLPSLVEAALQLGSRRPGRVWILSSDLWTQTLSLPAHAVAGLRMEEIGRALSFEAEPFSNISALEALTAQVALPDQNGQRSFWLTEMPAAVLQQIEYAVGQAHGRLVGISHPAGLPRPLSPELAAQGAWQRVELWPGAAVGVQGGPGRRTAVFVRNADPRPGRWEADLPPRQGEKPAAVEFLHAASAVALEELPAEHRLSLQDPEGLARFLGAWAKELAADSELPLLYPPQRPMSTNSRRTVAGVLGLVALLICLALQLGIHHYQTKLEEETARLREPAERLAQLRKECDQQQTRRGELQKACAKTTADLAHYRQVMQLQRQRLSALLTVLARSESDDLVIRKIDGSGDAIVLHGVCMRPELASILAGDLAEALGPLPWQVQPPDKKSREQLAEGGPWEFDLRIQDATPSGSPRRAEIAPAARRAGRPL